MQVLKTCFLGTTCMVMYKLGSIIKLHNSVLQVQIIHGNSFSNLQEFPTFSSNNFAFNIYGIEYFHHVRGLNSMVYKLITMVILIHIKYIIIWRTIDDIFNVNVWIIYISLTMVSFYLCILILDKRYHGCHSR